MRAAGQQPNTGVARQVSRTLQVDLAVGEQRVDVVGAGFHLRHPGPAGHDDVLRVVLVGEQAHRARFDAQRNVLADQRDSLALGGEVGGTAQDAGVVGVGAETGRQHAGVAVVELDVQRTALCPNRNGLIEPSMLDAEIVEQAQRLAGEPAQLVVVALGLQLTDHYQRNNHFMFGEAGAGPRIGQQHRRVEHVGPDGVLGNRCRISHERSSSSSPGSLPHAGGVPTATHAHEAFSPGWMPVRPARTIRRGPRRKDRGRRSFRG